MAVGEPAATRPLTGTVDVASTPLVGRGASAGLDDVGSPVVGGSNMLSITYLRGASGRNDLGKDIIGRFPIS